MGVIADLIRAGVAPELIEKVHDELVETAQSAAPMTARQLRNARYYQARKERLKASGSVLQDADKTGQDAPEPSRVDNNHASAPVSSNGSSLRSEPELITPLPSVGPQGGGDEPAAPVRKSNRGTRLPPDWRPTEAEVEKCVAMGYSRDWVLGEGLEAFREYWLALPGAKATKLNWGQTFCVRMREHPQRRFLTSKSPARAGPPPRRRLAPTERLALGILSDADEDEFNRNYANRYEPQNDCSDPPAYDGPTIDLSATSADEPRNRDEACRSNEPPRGSEPFEEADFWGPRAAYGGHR